MLDLIRLMMRFRSSSETALTVTTMAPARRTRRVDAVAEAAAFDAQAI
jgi:hypothetical protein